MKPKNMPGRKFERRLRALSGLPVEHPDHNILVERVRAGHAAALAIRTKKDRSDRAKFNR